MKISRGFPPRKQGLLPALLWLALALGACAGEGGLVQVERPAAISWTDDGSLLELSQAVAHSIAYYNDLPPETRFVYGDLSYSPREMIASMELFRDTFYAAPDPQSLSAMLAERFHVFESVAEEEGGALFTGYYEPELEASENPSPPLDTPLYALPSDIVKVRLQLFGANLPPQTLMGRVEGGELIPYFTRREIQAHGSISQRAAPIAYVDEVDLFFLQIQGSGVLRFPDGRRVKVGYAASNGHPYRSIGALLVQRGEMELENVSLQSLRAYLAENQERARRLLYRNPSYVFFQVREEGPFGNIRVPLTPGRSLALDHLLFPKGGLAYVMTTVPVPFGGEETRPFRRFMLVQDTGGAIRGHGRGDLFFGAGKGAEWQAGHQRGTGRLLLLVGRKEFLPPEDGENR